MTVSAQTAPKHGVAAPAAPAPEVAAEWREEDAGRIGLWLFLLSETLLFGAFFAAYITSRLGNPDCALGVTVWPEAGHLPGLALATLNTVLLLTSSYTMVRAISRAERGDTDGFRANLRATIALGAGFLLVKACEYSLKISHGYYLGSEAAAASAGLSVFLSYYYAMTILHALHVIAGVLWNSVLLAVAGQVPALGSGVPAPGSGVPAPGSGVPAPGSGVPAAALARKAEYAGIYWHFVDVIWVFLFPLFYLI